MRGIYTFSIRIYYVIICLAQYFNPKAKKWIVGRKASNQNYPKIPASKKVMWFHCASLGEFDQALPLMNLLKEKNSDIFILVTFFSPSGFEHYHKRKHQVDFACYLPIDIPSKARNFLKHFSPSQAFFVKYEFWSNFIFEAKKQDVKVYSVCTIFRENHRFFKWYGSFFRKTLRQLDYFFVQNQQSIDLLKSIGLSNASLVGDLRFDRVIENKKLLEKDSILEQFIYSKEVWVLGSSWSIDESFLAQAVLNFDGQIILAPHDISEKHLLEIEQRFSGETIRYTHFSAEKNKKIIILDCIGKLANAYSYGTFAYVGGGFTGSLHNILEPAVFGLPVLFGPKHKRFPEAQLFLDQQVGFSVSSEEELNDALKNIKENLESLQLKITDLVQANTGASEKIYALL
jgi:3-deoxy-D-manno-octulosonic-acid transferase